MQDVAREDRDERAVVAEDRERRFGREDQGEDRALQGVLDAAPGRAPQGRAGPGHRRERRADEQQGEDDREVADGVHEERARRSHRGDEDAGDRGTEQRREPEDDRAQGHGVLEVGARDELRIEGVARRRVEGRERRVHEADHVDVPELDRVRRDERPEDERRDDLGALSDDEQPLAVDPVRQRAAEQREREDRQAAHEATDPEEHGRAGDRV